MVQELTDPQSPRRSAQASAPLDTRTQRTAVAEGAHGSVPGADDDSLGEAVTADPALVHLTGG